MYDGRALPSHLECGWGSSSHLECGWGSEQLISAIIIDIIDIAAQYCNEVPHTDTFVILNIMLHHVGDMI